MDDSKVPGTPVDDDTRANRAASNRDAVEGGNRTTIPPCEADALHARGVDGDAQGGVGRPAADE